MSTFVSVRELPLPSPPPTRPSRWSLIRAWLPTFFWIGVIAFESTALFTSEHTQGWLFTMFRAIFGANLAARVAPLVNEYGRKVGHFTGYGILGGLSFFAWTEWLRYRKQVYLASIGRAVEVVRRWHLRAAALAVLVVFAVASADEFHQAYVPGRGSSFHDVILDTMGGVCAQLLILLFWKAGMKAQRRIEPALETSKTGTRA